MTSNSVSEFLYGDSEKKCFEPAPSFIKGSNPYDSESYEDSYDQMIADYCLRTSHMSSV